MTRLFSTGEFAKLCGVKKDTVLYYDKIGLLKPEQVNEKGYRYYSMKDMYFMCWVMMMRSCGISLEMIMAYRENAEADNLLAMINANNEKLIAERDELDFRIKCNRLVLDTAEYLQDMEQGVCKILTVPEEYYIAGLPYYSDAKVFEDTIDFELQYLDELMEYMEAQNIYISHLEGSVVNYAAYQLEEPCFRFIETIFEKADCDRFWVKAAGKYLCVINQENYDANMDTIEMMHDYAEQHGLKLSDDTYIYPMVEYHLICDVEDDLFCYMIQILD